jgi:hypothetical protein
MGRSMIVRSVSMSKAPTASQKGTWLKHWACGAADGPTPRGLEVNRYGFGKEHWKAAAKREAMAHATTRAAAQNMGMRCFFCGVIATRRERVLAFARAMVMI